MLRSSFHAVLVIGLALPLAAQDARKLSGPLARAPVGDFGTSRTSPNGKTLVYSSARGEDGQRELYSVPLEGGVPPVRLRGPGPDQPLAITQSGERVLFLADPAGNGSHEIVSAAIDGSTPQVVLTTLGPGGRVVYFEETPEGGGVVFLGQSAGSVRLFHVPLSGSRPPLELSGPLVDGGSVLAFRPTLDGREVVYLADARVDERAELFVVPLDGSTPPRALPIPLVAEGDVFQLELGAGGRVVYTADQDEDERVELFSLPIDGSEPPRRLNGPLVPGGDVGSESGGAQFPYFAMSPDHRWALYQAEQEVDGRHDLHAVLVDGTGADRRLSSDADGVVSPVAIGPDSLWVVYLGESVPDVLELFAVPIDGSAPARRLNAPLVAGGSVSGLPRISLDGRSVVYRADQEVDEQWELFVAPIDGSAPARRLSGPLPPDGDVGFTFAGAYGDAQEVTQEGALYLAGTHPKVLDLHFAPFEGGPPRELLAGPLFHYSWSPSAPDVVVAPSSEQLLALALEGEAKAVELDRLDTTIVGDVRGFQLSADGDRVAYSAQGEGDLFTQVYAVRTREPGRPELLSVGLQDTFVATFELSEGAERVLFEANLNALYSSDVEGGVPPVELRPVFGNGHRGGSYTLAPDGTTVAYFLAGEVFVAPVDGSTAPREVSTSLPPGTPIGRIRFSLNGSRVAFIRGLPGPREILCVAPADAGAPGACVAEAVSVEDDFELDPRGEQVFFRARQANGSIELFVAPSDGSSAPRGLHPPFPAGRMVSAFALTPDRARVVFLADVARAGTFELHAVATDGSDLPVRLHPALPATRDVLDFSVASDGRFVVYRADARVDEQLELFAAPVQGGSPPLRLSGELVPGGDVLEFAITPDARRVLYRADRASDQLVELYSTSIQGGREARLSEPLVAGGDVVSFRISADSRRVVFAAEYDADGRRTLLDTSTTGREKARRVAGPFSAGGSVHEYALDHNGSTIVYVADQEQMNRHELYAVRRKLALLR